MKFRIFKNRFSQVNRLTPISATLFAAAAIGISGFAFAADEHAGHDMSGHDMSKMAAPADDPTHTTTILIPRRQSSAAW